LRFKIAKEAKENFDDASRSFQNLTLRRRDGPVWKNECDKPDEIALKTLGQETAPATSQVCKSRFVAASGSGIVTPLQARRTSSPLAESISYSAYP
jgi:hypothetical protein